MRVGLIARADDRGLGYQTWDFARHMHPDRILVVREPGAEAQGFTPHLDRYPGADVVTYNPYAPTGAQLVPDATVISFLRAVDVIYTAETFYDPAMLEWANELGVATVCHANPEFWTGRDRPTVVWAPSTWRLAHLPPDAIYVPVPVPTAPHRREARQIGAPVRFVHVAGNRAAHDRNGTVALYKALRLTTAEIHIRIITQTNALPSVRWPSNVHAEIVAGGVADRWSMYADADVLVMARRYGGLCLPVLEGLACGVVPVMTDTSPNHDWPAIRVPAHHDHRAFFDAPCGRIHPVDVDVAALAEAMDEISAGYYLGNVATEGAALPRWDVMAPAYRARLAEAVDAAR